MRLGRRKNICIRLFPAHTRPWWEHVNKLLVVWLSVLIVAIAVTAGYRRAVRIVRLTIEHRVENLAVRLIHETVNEQILKNGFAYEDFAVISTDASGKIQSIAVNTNTANRMKTEIALAIEEKVRDLPNERVQVPYLAFFVDELVTGDGPCVEFELSPAGHCFIDFENSFSEAGINQTKHQIDIVIKADFNMMTAVAGEGVSVETSVPVAQTVIVGTVPNSYFKIQR